MCFSEKGLRWTLIWEPPGKARRRGGCAKSQEIKSERLKGSDHGRLSRLDSVDSLHCDGEAQMGFELSNFTYYSFQELILSAGSDCAGCFKAVMMIFKILNEIL